MKTALYDQHVALGAKMVEFAGWEMPVYYTGVIPEHYAVRSHAGLFDVSHMGRIFIEGLQAEPFLDYLSTNKIAGKPPGAAVYTVLCNEKGGAVDDVIIYKIDDTHFFLVVNAANRQKDLNHLIAHSVACDVIITDHFAQDAILALQGPKASSILLRIFPEFSLSKPMSFTKCRYRDCEAVISTTGYTGAGGFELCVPNEVVCELWKEILDKGKSDGVVPAGLGARDTLRLEMGYALYGHELNDGIRPIESVSHWTVKLNQHDFLGKEFQGEKRHTQYGAVLLDKGIAREGYLVFQQGVQIGRVTSGTFSPTLQKAVAIIQSNKPLSIGESIEVQIRGKACAAEVVKLPFLPPEVL